MSGKASKGVLKNAFTVGLFTAFSRVLGLVREMLQARFIGAGVEQSAFTLAFAIPNMARKLFGEGALTAAFVPIFKNCVETEGLEKAGRLSRAVMTMVLLVLSAVVAFSLAGVLAGVAAAEGYRPHLTLQLVAILLPYMLAICGAAFGMGVLNSLGKFKASSFMPAFLNIIWIGALSALAFFPGASTASRIRFVSAAILVGGFAQMIFMFVCMKKAGVPIVPDFSGWRTDKVRLVWKNLGIAALGTGAVQVNCMLDQVLAQFASPWAAGVIGYAERLMDLPLGVVGVAFGTVLLPTFSGLFAHKDMEGAKSAFVASIRNQLLVMVPAGVGMALLAPDITKVVYEGGSFDGLATLRVSRSLSVYAAGLVLFSFQKAIVPWFQAQGDMKTPFAVSIVTVVVNALLNVAAVFLLPIEFRHVGLAVSTVFCSFLGCVILASKAVAKNGSFGFGTEKFRFLVICCAAAVMGVVVCALKRFLPEINAYFSLFVLVASGVAVYASLVLPLRKLWRAL